MLVLISLALGVLLALLVRPSVSPEQSRYLAMAVIAALDASMGGLRAHLEQTFSDSVFVLSFLSNAVLAVALVWLGDQLGVDFTTPVVVVLGVRIFQNLAAVRRRVLRW